jgi:hypothetical protein
MKFFRGCIFLFVFSFLLITFYGFHISFFNVDVVFYAALIDVALAALMSFLLLLFLSYFQCFSRFEKSLLILICILSGYSLAISIPTLIDRSLSFYILEKLQQRGGAIFQASIPQVFINEYMSEARLVDVRLTEQLESGTIVIQEGCVKLTVKGNAIASFGQYFRKNWLPKKRLLLGTYSDALVDPFRGRPNPNEDYTCAPL